MTQEQFLADFMSAIFDWLPLLAALLVALVPVNFIMGMFNHAITRFVSDPFREK